jgi:hypothetical protein
MVAFFGGQLLLWLLGLTLEAIKALWGLLADTAFTTPDVTTLPQVQAIAGKSLIVVNVAFVLAIITAGITVMTHETVQVRYGIGELAPRLVVGWIAANFSMPLCSQLTELANALTGALTGEGVASQGAFAQLLRVTTDAMTNPTSTLLTLVIGLMIAVLTGMLLVAWLVRLGVLIVWVGIAPLALACHATPYTDGAARLWWRTGLACLGTVIVQALALHTALRIFLDPAVNIPSFGLPNDPTGTMNLFIVACLLWVTIKIPALMRRYVTRGGGGNNIAGAFVRLVLVQQLTRMLRIPLPRRGGRAAAGAASGLSVANTVIPYWRPRPPRPTPALARSTRTAASTATTAAPTPTGSAPAPAMPAAATTGARTPARPRVPAGLTPATVMPPRRPSWQVRSRPSGTGWPTPPSAPAQLPPGARPTGTGWVGRSTATRSPRYPTAGTTPGTGDRRGR